MTTQHAQGAPLQLVTKGHHDYVLQPMNIGRNFLGTILMDQMQRFLGTYLSKVQTTVNDSVLPQVMSAQDNSQLLMNDREN